MIEECKELVIPEKIKHLKVRNVELPNFGTVKITQYITRIDIEKTNTHGWQVRFEKPSTFFSDFSCGNIINSLQQSLSFLAVVYYPRLIKRPVKENKNKKIPLGIRGVRIVKMKKKNRSTEELYAEAIPMKHGESAKRFYIGTAKTATPEKMEIAINKAKKCRQRFELEGLFSS
ncbi:MAG: hypothetical protein V4525_11060 [Pseudomonadota bacterium]